MFSGDRRLLIRKLYVKLIPLFIRKNIDEYTRLGFPNYYKKSGIIFVHIPKAAGTSFTHHLYAQTIAHLPLDFVKKSDADLFYKLPKFTVTRNPYDRLVSAYRFVRDGGTSDVTVENSNYYQGKVFNSFDSFVIDWLAFQDLSKLDFVFKTQTYFINCSNIGELDYIGKIDDLSETIKWLGKYQDMSNFRSKNVTKGNVNWRTYYSNPLVKNIVSDLYSEDFENFGYSKEV